MSRNDLSLDKSSHLSDEEASPFLPTLDISGNTASSNIEKKSIALLVFACVGAILTGFSGGFVIGRQNSTQDRPSWIRETDFGEYCKTFVMKSTFLHC